MPTFLFFMVIRSAPHFQLINIITQLIPGHGQSGQFISCKTQFLQAPLIPAIRESLEKNASHLKIHTVNFYYPTGMFPANPDHPHVENNTSWAWGYGEAEVERMSGYQESIQQLLAILEEYGPFVGIMGFSTGATLAAALTSILDARDFHFGTPFEVRNTERPFILPGPALSNTCTLNRQPIRLSNLRYALVVSNWKTRFMTLSTPLKSRLLFFMLPVIWIR
jgi:hypothetical protein